jgi:hypothetical protein
LTRLLLLVLAVSALPASVEAARVRLQARARLTLRLEESEGRVLVRGRLVDARDAAVEGAAVALEIAPADGTPLPEGQVEGAREAVARTNARGHFEHGFARMALPHGAAPVQVAAHFAGDLRHAGTDAHLEATLGLPTPTLELEVLPTSMQTGDDAATARVLLRVGDLPLPGRAVFVRAGENLIGEGATNELGELRLPVTGAAIGALGPRTIRARAPGDETFGPASAAVAIELLASVRVVAEVVPAGQRDECDDEVVCIEGAVSRVGVDGLLAPPPPAAVTLHAERVRLGSVRVGEDGRFSARLRMEVLTDLFAPGPIGVVAEAVVAEPYHPPGWSEVFAIDVPPRRSPFEWVYAGLVLLLVLGFVWRRWWDRRSQQQILGELAAAGAGLPPVAVRSVGPGAGGHRIDGRVIDGERGGACAAAVVVQRPGEPDDHHALADGRLQLDRLAEGPLRLVIDAPEHELLVLELQIPHDGTYDGCEFLPTSTRAAVRGALSASVGEASGRPIDWGRETPRTAEPRWLAARRRGHVRIRAAVRAVEDAIYGRRLGREQGERTVQQLRAAEESE